MSARPVEDPNDKRRVSEAAGTDLRPVSRVHRHASPLGDWEVALGEPSPRLRAIMYGGYTGSIERPKQPVRRLEVAMPGIVCIINFGAPFVITDPRRPHERARVGSFVAGLYDSCVHVDSHGISGVVQFNLTPLGAAALLRRPLSDVTNRSVPLADLLGASALDLEERIAGAASWEDRFEIVERTLLRRLDAAPTASPLLLHAWQELTASAGRLPIGELTRRLSCSRKHLVSKFNEHVGLPPKTMARILRFHHVVEQLVHSRGRRLSEVAHNAGYYDHAHFDRDFHEFAGVTPSEYLAIHVPTFGAVLRGD